MISINAAIHQLYPQAVRTVGEDAFDADGNPVTYDRALVEIEAQRMSAQQSRASAYAAEADPLFFKVQRGEADQADYDAKIAEIRTRYPYPTTEAQP
jgi:hypothetical protein